jgi:hypothetical protein
MKIAFSAYTRLRLFVVLYPGLSDDESYNHQHPSSLPCVALPMIFSTGTPGRYSAVELGYNAMKGTEYFESL